MLTREQKRKGILVFVTYAIAAIIAFSGYYVAWSFYCNWLDKKMDKEVDIVQYNPKDRLPMPEKVLIELRANGFLEDVSFKLKEINGRQIIYVDPEKDKALTAFDVTDYWVESVEDFKMALSMANRKMSVRKMKRMHYDINKFPETAKQYVVKFMRVYKRGVR